MPAPAFVLPSEWFHPRVIGPQEPPEFGYHWFDSNHPDNRDAAPGGSADLSFCALASQWLSFTRRAAGTSPRAWVIRFEKSSSPILVAVFVPAGRLSTGATNEVRKACDCACSADSAARSAPSQEQRRRIRFPDR